MLSVYAAPNVGIGADVWRDILRCVPRGDEVLICEDLNAYSPLWGFSLSDLRGREMCSEVLDFGLVPLNDTLPTFLPGPETNGGNLDLVFLTASLAKISSLHVTEDTHGFDHFLVTGELAVSLDLARSTSNRFNTNNLDCGEFCGRMGAWLPGFLLDLEPPGRRRAQPL